MGIIFGSAPQRYVGVDLARWPVHRVLIGFLMKRGNPMEFIGKGGFSITPPVLAGACDGEDTRQALAPDVNECRAL